MIPRMICFLDVIVFPPTLILNRNNPENKSSRKIMPNFGIAIRLLMNVIDLLLILIYNVSMRWEYDKNLSNVIGRIIRI